MNRLVFLMIAVIVVSILGVPASAAEYRAFWVDAWHSGFENPTATTTMINYVNGCNANAVVMEVRKRADAYYVSSYEPTGWNITPEAGYDCLADVVSKAHTQSIEVHAWVVVNRVWTFTTPPPPTTPTHVYTAHPEWFSQTDTGGMYDSANGSWLDPGHPEVETYHRNVFMEIISNYNIDGFHLDYIRYPGTHWGYNATAVARFNAEYGQSGSPRWNDSQWMNWRRDQITNMVKRIYLEAKAVKPAIKMGASVWNTAGTGNSTYYQNWDLWMHEHLLDYCSPMNYSSSNATFNSNCDDAYGRQYGRHIYMGQGSYVNAISNSMIQIQYVQNKPFPGVSLYSYYATNSGTIDRPGFQSALLAGPFASAQNTPDMPWISSPTTGMLKGFVKDTAGNAIYPATVTVIGPGKTTKNSGTGFYGFVDLSPATYTIRVTANGYPVTEQQVTISAGAVANLDFSLSNEDTTPPVISNVHASTGQTTATITWNTDEPATSQVEYGLTTSYGTLTTLDPALVTSHSVGLSGLTRRTTYHYRVHSIDAAENEGISGDYTFKTK